MSATTGQAGADRDSKDLAGFGYKQELRRGLGTFSSFAVAFSYISPSTGIFTLYFIGLATIGGAFIWTWPVVALGQFIIALNFAEVSSHYPIAGSVFQWTKYLANRTYAWFSGWIYLFAGILTVTAVVATLPLALIPAINGLPTLFGQAEWSLSGSLHAQLLVALIALVVITVLNIYGVRLVAIVNNTGVIFEILGMFVFALVLALFHNHQGVHVITNTAGTHVGASTFLGAMFMSLFVIYGFDTASTLAEETRDPRRAAPKAVLFSIVGAFVIGGMFLLGTLMAIPDKGTVLASGCHGVAPACQHTLATAVRAAQQAAYGPVQIIQSNFSPALATVYLLVVSAAIFVCCLSILAATIRLGFGMARDNQLPFSGLLSKVSPNLHTPLWTCVTIAVLAAVPFIQYSGAGTVAVAATAMIYFSYLAGNLAILIARLKGWPKTAAPFRLGRFGLIVNVLGLLYGGAMLVNFAWPPAANAAGGPRLTSNPRPDQTGGLLNFHIGFLNGIPILWTVFVFIALVGTLYYLLAGRRKTFAPVVTPAGDDAPLSA